jgi:imidazolonepropionase-like amidohydrolase
LQSSYKQIAEEEYRIVRGAEDARLAVRENVNYGARVIKIYANNTPNPNYLSMEEMRAIVEEAKLLRIKVAAHATNDIAVRRAVEAGVDSIEHGYEIKDETLALMKQRGTALVPTDIDDFSLKRYAERTKATSHIAAKVHRKQPRPLAPRDRRRGHDRCGFRQLH